jgi:hypothetical protein
MRPVSPGGNRLTVALVLHPNWQRRTRGFGVVWLWLGARHAYVGPAGFFRASKNILIQLKNLQNLRICHVLM